MPERPAHRIGEAQRAAEPEVDASGMESLEHQELFGDDERLVIGQHHAT